MTQVLLEIAGLGKAFPGVQALEDVSLTVRAGEIHALIGENGAGKSTLMKVLAGIHLRDSGTVLLDGRPVAPKTPADALRLGISSVHQEISLAPNLTVAENIFVGREPTRLDLIDWRQLYQRTDDLLGRFGVRLDPKARVGSLSLALRQIVEIARALSHEPGVLMLDEPTSSLEAHEVTRLFKLLRDLAEAGMGIIYVTHKLKEVFQIAHTVTVLRDGKWVASKPITQTNIDEIVRLMVGRELNQLYPPKAVGRGPELLRVEDLSLQSLQGRFQNISFTLCEGEILGLAGLVGAGRSEVAQTLFGHHVADAGHVYLAGRELNIQSPLDAVQQGIAYLPEDRKASGLFRQMSLKENLFSASLDRHSRGGFIRERDVRRAAATWVRDLDIRTPSIDQQMSLLSGGNQQKALIARWLDLKPRVLIADEPTRGIDVGAKAEIHALLRRLCQEGIGVIVISSELPEILGLCDRILVLHEGRLAGEIAAAEATEESIMRLATGQELEPEAA
jgi:inositol transport system ATP-binding protein